MLQLHIYTMISTKKKNKNFHILKLFYGVHFLKWWTGAPSVKLVWKTNCGPWNAFFFFFNVKAQQ